MNMKTIFNKNNRGLTSLIIFTLLLLVEFIKLVISARYYGNIEFANKEVKNIPFGITNVSAFVTESSSYTSITWLFALFVLVLLVILTAQILKRFDLYMYINKFNGNDSNYMMYKKVKNVLFYTLSIFMILATLRSGLFSAMDLHAVSSSFIYMVSYGVYFVITHPIIWVVVVFMIIAPIIAPSREMTAEEKANMERLKQQRDEDYRRRKWKEKHGIQ